MLYIIIYNAFCIGQDWWGFLEQKSKNNNVVYLSAVLKYVAFRGGCLHADADGATTFVP